MELIRYWRVIRRWAWLIILCPFVAGLSAGLISLELPKVYEAKVALLVRPAQPLSGDPSVAALTADQILRTYARWMTEPPILQKVIADQNLQTDPVALSRQITVTPEPNTTILDVAVRDTDSARAMNTANTLVNDFIAQVKETQQTEATPSSKDNFVVVAPAVQPTQPVFPKPLLNIVLGLFVGLIVGIGLAFLLDYLDQSVRSDEILRERAGLVPLGHIAYTPAKSERRGELVTLGGDSPVVEAYKALRTNLGVEDHRHYVGGGQRGEVAHGGQSRHCAGSSRAPNPARRRGLPPSVATSNFRSCAKRRALKPVCPGHARRQPLRTG